MCGNNGKMSSTGINVNNTTIYMTDNHKSKASVLLTN